MADLRKIILFSLVPAFMFAPVSLLCAGQAPGELTLDAALEFAWDNHPAMKEVQHMVAAAHGTKAQAGLWPRPELGVTSMEKSSDENETGVFIAQKFELGGKRSARISVADAMIFAKEAGILDSWLKLRADIKQSFAKLDYARQIAQLLAQMADADSDNEKLCLSLNSAGKLSAGDLIDAQKQAAVSKALASAATVMLANTEQEALFTVGIGATNVSAKLVCPDSCLLGKPDTGALLSAAQTNNASIRNARAARLLAEAEVRLARSSTWPDLTLKAEYTKLSMADGDGNGSALMAYMDLPLLNRAQGDRLRAKEEKRALISAEEATALDVGASIVGLAGEYAKRSAEEEYSMKVAVPLSEKKHSLNEDSFRKGRLSKRDYLRSLTELIKAKMEYAEAKLMSQTTGIELERLAPAILPQDTLRQTL